VLPLLQIFPYSCAQASTTSSSSACTFLVDVLLFNPFVSFPQPELLESCKVRQRLNPLCLNTYFSVAARSLDPVKLANLFGSKLQGLDEILVQHCIAPSAMNHIKAHTLVPLPRPLQ
jgi:hypothetical protein